MCNAGLHCLRARWSDLRYIHRVDIESGCLVLYTREHKTSAVGEGREQCLPLIVPWHGVTKDDWLSAFLSLYKDCGLDRHHWAHFYRRPEMEEPSIHVRGALKRSRWLRLLLAGAGGSEKFRSHSMKITLLNWSVRAGTDKEKPVGSGLSQKEPDGSQHGEEFRRPPT